VEVTPDRGDDTSEHRIHPCRQKPDRSCEYEEGFEQADETLTRIEHGGLG
jgi:hypothetical protein